MFFTKLLIPIIQIVFSKNFQLLSQMKLNIPSINKVFKLIHLLIKKSTLFKVQSKLFDNLISF